MGSVGSVGSVGAGRNSSGSSSSAKRLVHSSGAGSSTSSTGPHRSRGRSTRGDRTGNDDLDLSILSALGI